MLRKSLFTFHGQEPGHGALASCGGVGETQPPAGPHVRGLVLEGGRRDEVPVAPSPEKAALPDSKRQTAHAAHTHSEHGAGTRSRPLPRPGVTAPGQDGVALPRRPLHPGPPGGATGKRAAPPHTARLRPDAASAPAGCLTAGEAAAGRRSVPCSLPPRAGQAAGAWLRRVARIQLEPGLASPQLPARGRRKVTGAQAQVTPEWPGCGHTASPGCEEPGKRSLLSLLSSSTSSLLKHKNK